jgi:uncharacterized protein
VDLWGTSSLSGFINETANAVIQSSIFNKKSFSEKLTGWKKYFDSMPLEAKLRSLFQRYHNIRFIFSGSEQHLISDIFSSIDKPFYQSTRMFEIKKIDTALYHRFITKHFQKGKKSILEKQVFYTELPHRLTRHQFSTTRAIASLGKAEGLTTRDFMAKAEIDSPGTMQSVIKALKEKQVIIKEGNAYRLYDVFLNTTSGI